MLSAFRAINLAARRPSAHMTDDQDPSRPRLCPQAFVGLLWSICFAAVALPAWLMVRVIEEDAVVSLGEQLYRAFLWLSLAGILGGPLVSASAKKRIRRAAGALSGLPMATVGLHLPGLTIAAMLSFMLITMSITSLVSDAGLRANLQLVAAALVIAASLVALVQLARQAAQEEAALR